MTTSANDVYFYRGQLVDGEYTCDFTQEVRGDELVYDTTTDEASLLVEKLDTKFRYFMKYRVKDLSDGAMLCFVTSFFMDTTFYMVAAPKDEPSSIRLYRADRVNAHGKQVFKKCSEDALATVKFRPRNSQVDCCVDGIPVPGHFVCEFGLDDQMFFAIRLSDAAVDTLAEATRDLTTDMTTDLTAVSDTSEDLSTVPTLHSSRATLPRPSLELASSKAQVELPPPPADGRPGQPVSAARDRCCVLFDFCGRGIFC